MGTLDGNGHARPTLRDIDKALLKQFLQEETELWRKRCSGLIAEPEEVSSSTSSESEPPTSKDIAVILLRHGKVLHSIHNFFQKLIPRRYLMRLGCQMDPDFQVVLHPQPRMPFPGTHTVAVTLKESERQLHTEVYDIYMCTLLAARYPVLVSSQDSLCSNSQDDPDPQTNHKHTESRLTPASQECMLYDKDPISPSSVFPIDSDVLTELVRKAFCLNQRRHTIYKNVMETNINNDPAKLLLQEMREQLTILKNGWHPFFQPNIFYNKDDYYKWLEKETSEIEQIILQQEQLLQTPVTSLSITSIPRHFKDKHLWYNTLLAKLFKLDNSNSQKNIATDEAIPLKPLSAESSRLLNEFGERYRVGELYRRISLLDYLARNFETKAWYCRHVTSVLESIMQRVHSGGCFVVIEEIRIFKNAVVSLNAQVEHSLSRINRLFPKNIPDGGLQAVISLLSMLVLVDQDEVMGGQDGKSVGYYLKKYTREEMRTNYERQKIIIADQLKIRKFSQQSTPRMVNLMILDLSEKLRIYRMFFKNDFIKYFDIVEMAIEIFYGLLMEDVLELCETHPTVDQQGIDYAMIALAYRLSSFDKDPAWKNYLSLEKQTWRQAFLKHSLSWMTSLRYRLQEFLTMASQQDSWKEATTQESITQETNSDSKSSPQQEKRLNHGLIHSVGTASPVITPSANSAFIQVGSRRESYTEQSSVIPQANSYSIRQKVNTENQEDRSKESSENVTRSSTQSSNSPNEHNYSNQPNCATCGQVSKTDHSCGRTTTSDSFSEVDIHAGQERDSLATSSRTREDSFLSIHSQSSEAPSDYVDARSQRSDSEDMTTRVGESSIPVSSSLIDLLGCMNRVVGVTCHFAQLLCPDITMIDDPLRRSPEDRPESMVQLKEGRVNLAKELGDILGSVAIVYGYQVLCAECCGINDNILQNIIGKRCLAMLLSQLENSDVRLCRYNTAGVTRCNTVDSQGNFVPPCSGIHRTQNSITQCEKLVKEMCIRVNNIRTMKIILATLIETAVNSVLEPGSRLYTEHDVTYISDTTSVPSTSNETGASSCPGSTVSVEFNNAMDKNSIIKRIEELQQIEKALVKLMAFRANALIRKLLQLLLTLNLRNFTYHERLQPVLDTMKRTIQTLASHLYHDSYVVVLHNFWLHIVKDFEEETTKLVFFNGTAKGQAELLLQAVSLFIEVFRAEGDIIPLTVISKSIEPILRSLDFYILPSSSLIEMYQALQMRNDNVVRLTKDSDIRILTRYQKPSEVLIERLRIELHSESDCFSGHRFVECVADQIRYEGNLKLGICAGPNATDEDNAAILGQYLVDNGIIHFFGKGVPKSTENSVQESTEFDQVFKSYTRRGSCVLVQGRKSPFAIVNDVPAFKESPACSPTIVVQEDSGEGSSKFSDSEFVLYKFRSSDIEESVHVLNDEYHVTTSDDGKQHDLVRVLFTRRNIEKEANNFLTNLGDKDIVQDLTKEYAEHHHSFADCCRPRGMPT